MKHWTILVLVSLTLSGCGYTTAQKYDEGLMKECTQIGVTDHAGNTYHNHKVYSCTVEEV